jgi:ketosteroid isomerase-like protein
MSTNGGHPSKRASDAAVDLIREVLSAFNRGDAQAAAEFLADDVEWHEIGRAEPFRGKAEMASRWGEAIPEWEITSEVHDILANDEHAIALVEATAGMGGRSFTYRTAEIYHFRDGKITHRWAFSDDTARINEFFAGI